MPKLKSCECTDLVWIAPKVQGLFHLPEWVCACDLTDLRRRFATAGWAGIYVSAAEVSEVLKTMGYPLQWAPSHIGTDRALIWEWWGDAWAVALLGAWQDAGLRLFSGSFVHLSLRHALRRGTDPEFRAAVSTVLTYGGARALSEYLAGQVQGEHKP